MFRRLWFVPKRMRAGFLFAGGALATGLAVSGHAPAAGPAAPPPACAQAQKLEQQGKAKQAAQASERCQQELARRRAAADKAAANQAKRQERAQADKEQRAALRKQRQEKTNERQARDQAAADERARQLRVQEEARVAERAKASQAAAGRAQAGAGPSTPPPSVQDMLSYDPLKPKPPSLDEQRRAVEAKYGPLVQADGAQARAKKVNLAVAGVTLTEPLKLAECTVDLTKEVPVACANTQKFADPRVQEAVGKLLAYDDARKARAGTATRVHLSKDRPRWMEPSAAVFTADGRVAALAIDWVATDAVPGVLESLKKSYGPPNETETGVITANCGQRIEAPTHYYWTLDGMHIVYSTHKVYYSPPSVSPNVDKWEQQRQAQGPGTCVVQGGNVLYSAASYGEMVREYPNAIVHFMLGTPPAHP